MRSWSVTPAWLASSRPPLQSNWPDFPEDGQLDEGDNGDMDSFIVRDLVQEKDQASMVWRIRELISVIVKAFLLHLALVPLLPLAPSMLLRPLHLLRPLQLLGQLP